MSAPVAPRPALTGRAASSPRTLLQTVFYFEHALRELPMDLLLGLAVARISFYGSTGGSRSGRAWT